MVWGWLSLLLVGCGGECGPEECATVCAEAPPPGLGLTDGPEVEPEPAGPAITSREQAILDAVLEEVRAGIRPWPSEDAIGVCRGRKDCDRFLGTDAGKLSRGSFFVRADLKVPPGPPGTWTVTFHTECTTPDGQVSIFDREHDVVHNGGDRPTRLQPLRAFEVPSDEGPQTCTWKLVAPDPAGDRVFQGSWEVTR
jgi:hypothetical protein